ncbi:helix-turn-helix domain-containing protein [Eubacteriales bacterium OttesenSCG-928-N13]|nr:helix-turn-helix domain-containing protein [Eubacteriales bacterium OttesenSCG-928-N13]
MFSLLDATNGKNQTALGKLLGVSSGQMSTWRERGTDPKAKHIPQICEYLEITPYELLGMEASTLSVSLGVTERESSLTNDEETLLRRYRSLDDDGKEIVRSTALLEQRRMATEKGIEKTDAI